MQIKEMRSCAERRKMYAAWINTGNGWFFSDMLFDSVDDLKEHYEGMPDFLRIGLPSQAERWENAEIVVVSVEVSIPDETKEVQ